MKLYNLRSKRTGKPYSANLMLECRADGSPQFRFEFDHKEASACQKNDGMNT